MNSRLILLYKKASHIGKELVNVVIVSIARPGAIVSPSMESLYSLQRCSTGLGRKIIMTVMKKRSYDILLHVHFKLRQIHAQIHCNMQGWGEVLWYLYLSTLKYSFCCTCTCTCT